MLLALRVACTACARDCVLSSGVNGWSANSTTSCDFISTSRLSST